MDRELKYEVRAGEGWGQKMMIFRNVRSFAVTPKGHLIMFYFDDTSSDSIKLGQGTFLDIKVMNK